MNAVIVKKKEWGYNDNISIQIIFTNQVRSMVGCLVYLAIGKWNIDIFKKNFIQRKI